MSEYIETELTKGNREHMTLEELVKEKDKFQEILNKLEIQLVFSSDKKLIKSQISTLKSEIKGIEFWERIKRNNREYELKKVKMEERLNEESARFNFDMQLEKSKQIFQDRKKGREALKLSFTRENFK